MLIPVILSLLLYVFAEDIPVDCALVINKKKNVIIVDFFKLLKMYITTISCLGYPQYYLVGDKETMLIKCIFIYFLFLQTFEYSYHPSASYIY